MAGRGVNRSFDLPRLLPEWYYGDAVIHWILPVYCRQQGWLDSAFHAEFRSLMLHSAAREGLFCPTYCLMPDHLDLVWMGLRLDSDQRNAMAFLRTYLKPASASATPFFQHQAYDHVLKSHERQRNAFAGICQYILGNPLRAGLVTDPGAWPNLGAVIPGYPTLHPLKDDFWPKLWKLYAKAKSPDAAHIFRARSWQEPPANEPARS